MSFRSWWKNLGIGWFSEGPAGAAEGDSLGLVLDTEVSKLFQAAMAGFPEKGPADALPYIADDSMLIRGIPALETDQSFGTRLRKRWEQWKYASTPLGLLVQLYYMGYTDAVFAQQNGLAYRLTGAPVLTDLSTTPHEAIVLGPSGLPPQPPRKKILITITTGGVLGTMQFTYAVYDGGAASAAQASSATNPNFQVPGTITWIHFAAGAYVLNSTYTVNEDGTITRAGGAIDTVTQTSIPWFRIDEKYYFTSRWALLLPSQPTTWRHTALATFANESEKAVTWSTPFLGSATVFAIPGPPVGDNVEVWVENVTATGCTVKVSGPFTGDVFVIAWQAGQNPFAAPNADTLEALRKVIRRWRKGTTTCVGIFARISGAWFDYPLGVFDDGLAWQDGAQAVFAP